MVDIQKTGFLRLKQILGDPNSKPPILPIIPISSSTWFTGVKSGKYPSPVKLNTSIVAWRVEDIAAYIANPDAEKFTSKECMK